MIARRSRIVVGNSTVVGYPEAGGHFIVFLQYVLGLLELGHDVLWLELFHSSGNAVRDQHCLLTFFTRMDTYGVSERAAVLFVERGQTLEAVESCEAYGKSLEHIRAFLTSADLLLN